MKSYLSIFFLIISSLFSQAADYDISFINKKAHIELAATVTVPDCAPKAVIVMVTGSGPQNRDEEIMGHTPFRTLSDTLVAHGYATLRFDDRGTAASGGNFVNATIDDFLDDANAAVACADSIFNDIPVGVLGHSEGGITAVRIGASNEAADFIITLASPAWQGDSLLMSQCRALAVNSIGHWKGEALQRRILDIAISPLPPTAARLQIADCLKKEYGVDNSASAISSSLEKSAAAMTSKYMRHYLRFNPAPYISEVKCPWLALNGDKDLQVVPENLDEIHKLNPSATTLLVNGHNHLFQECATGDPSEYAADTPTPSARTCGSIVAWLNTLFE